MDPFLPDHSKIDAIRELLPSLASGVRLDVTMAGPFPAETDRAVHQLAEHELRVGRGGLERAEELAQRADEASSVLAAVLATSPDQVVLTPGPLAALSTALLAGGVPAQGSVAIVGETTLRLDEVVATVAAAHGMALVRTTASAIPPETVLAVAAHVDPATGRLADTGALSERAHAVGASLLLDVGWSVGAVPVDAPSSGADLVIADTHRWLLGPEGVTALWVADGAAADRVRALVDPLPLAQVVGVARSVGWLLMYVGLPWAFQRAETLTLRLRHALAVDGVVMEVPDRGIATTLPFAIRGWPASEAAVELGRGAHALIEVDEARDLLLASVGAWLREEEVDRFAAAVAAIAAHTPQTLPRRPMLTILSAAPGDTP